MNNVKVAEAFLMALAMALSLLLLNTKIQTSDDLFTRAIKLISFIAMVWFFVTAGYIAYLYAAYII